MSFYELLLLIHIAGAIVWLGSAFLLHVLVHRAERSEDPAALGRLFADASPLADRLFIPAALVVLAAGVGLTIDGPWSFGDLWIVLGLAGFAAGFVLGATVIGPNAKGIAEALARDGGPTPATEARMRRFFVLNRIDFLVLILILSAMVIKPTSDDVAVLAVMAVVLVGGFVFLVGRARAAAQAAPAPASTG